MKIDDLSAEEAFEAGYDEGYYRVRSESYNDGYEQALTDIRKMLEKRLVACNGWDTSYMPDCDRDYLRGAKGEIEVAIGRIKTLAGEE